MKNVTIPSSMLNPVFGKISYQTIGDENEVMFTIMVTSVGENWKTGVAIDASASMQGAFGKRLTGFVPPDIQKKYEDKGWVTTKEKDGDQVWMFEKKAYDDAIARGYLKWTENIVETEGRKFIEYLANRLDMDGSTSVIYWACGKGDEIEVLGEVQASGCKSLKIEGPKRVSFGASTHLLPALKYFEEQYRDTEKAMFIFITDGRLDDLVEVKSFCVELAKNIEKGVRNSIKCVLIGVGDKIDENQMIELDDLETGTDIDIWDHKIATDMRMIEEIFAELVDEAIVVTSAATIYDDSNNVVTRFTDGLPGRVIFRMPKTSAFFELEVGGQERIRQDIIAK